MKKYFNLSGFMVKPNLGRVLSKFLVYFFLIPSLILPQMAWAASGEGGEPPLRTAVSASSTMDTGAVAAASSCCSRRACAGLWRLLGWNTSKPVSAAPSIVEPGAMGTAGTLSRGPGSSTMVVNPMGVLGASAQTRRVLRGPVADSAVGLPSELEAGTYIESKSAPDGDRKSFGPGTTPNPMRNGARKSRVSHVVPGETGRGKPTLLIRGGVPTIVPLENMLVDDASSATGSGGGSPSSSGSEGTPPRGGSVPALENGAGTGLSAMVVANPLSMLSVEEGEAGDGKTIPHTAIAVGEESAGRSKDGVVGGKSIAVAGEEGGEDPIAKTSGALEEELTEADKAALRRFNDYIQNRLGLLSEGFTKSDLLKAGLMIIGLGLLAPAVRAMWSLVLGKTIDTLVSNSEDMMIKLLYSQWGDNFNTRYTYAIMSNVGIFWSPLVIATVWDMCQRIGQVYEQWTIQKKVPWYIYAGSLISGLTYALVEAVPATMMLYDQRHYVNSKEIGTTYVWWGLGLYALVPALRAWGMFKNKFLPTYANRGSEAAWKRKALGFQLQEAQRNLYAMKGPDLRPIYDEQARLGMEHPTLMQWLRLKPRGATSTRTSYRNPLSAFTLVSPVEELKGIAQLGKLVKEGVHKEEEPKKLSTHARASRTNSLKHYGYQSCMTLLMVFAALSAFAVGMGNYFAMENGLIGTFSGMAGHPDDSTRLKNAFFTAVVYERQQREIWEEGMAGSPVICNGGWNGTDWGSDLWDDRQIRYAGTSEWVSPPIEEEHPVEEGGSDDDSSTSSTNTLPMSNTTSTGTTNDDADHTEDSSDNATGSDDDHGWVRDVRFNAVGLPPNIIFGYSEGDFVKNDYNCWGWYDFIAARYTPGFLRDEALRVLAPELLDSNRVVYELPQGGKVMARIMAGITAAGMMLMGGVMLKNYMRRIQDGFSPYPEEVKPGKYYRPINGLNAFVSTVQGAVWSLPLAFFVYGILADRVESRLLFPFLGFALVPLAAEASGSFDDAYTSVVRWGKKGIYEVMKFWGRTYVPKWIVRDGLLMASISVNDAIQLADDRIIEALWKKFGRDIDPKFIELGKNPPPSKVQKVLSVFKRKPAAVA